MLPVDTIHAPAPVEQEEMLADHDACHLFPHGGHALFSYCGVPRAEQPRDHTIGNAPRTTPFCAGCGRRRCPECAAACSAEGFR